MDSPTVRTLTPLQNKIVNALAKGLSVSAAAADAGIHRVTIYKWLSTDKYFSAAVEQARAYHSQTVNDQLIDLSSTALAFLRDVLASPAHPPALRFRAALAILERPRSDGRRWQLPKPTRIEVDFTNDPSSTATELQVPAPE